MSQRGISFSKLPYAALWKSSIGRIQLVSGFHLVKIWATNSKSHLATAAYNPDL
jgi:hypothetical protein